MMVSALLRQAYSLSVILRSTILIIVSFLHFGQ